ncbi:MAG: gliding motility-associated C-terminal domain-containing protein, partial [Bacteroidota bacterium]|nr:gliding motility-associated C-terminal domain-containing protein [Bacteroidota bacterium]
IGKVQENISIGSYNFAKKPVKLKIWQNLPNGIEDPNANNDSIVKTIWSSLCGTYTIGGTSPDFATFSEAVAVLNTAGISCPVVFKVRNGTYNEQFAINNILGSSASNTVTFQSESGDSTKVMISHDVEGSITANLKHASYINFRKIGFAGYKGLVLDEYTNNINIEQCFLTGSNSALEVRSGSHHILISSSAFSAVPTAIFLENAKDIEIRNNIFNEQRTQGIGTSTSENVIVDGNRFNKTPTGVYLYNTKNSIVRNNRFNILTQQYAVNTGIYLTSCDVLSIYNNYINVEGNLLGTGIRMEYTLHTGIYYNSLNIATTDIGKSSKGLWFQTGDQNNIKNNIFNVKTSGCPVWIDAGTTGFSLDYNDYYSPSGLIGRLADTNYSSLKDWGKAVNGDANSKDIIPNYASDTNPLPYQRDFNGAGIPIGGILLDINGKIRNDQAPDIGAVEFMIDFGITQLISPNLDCVQGSSVGVTVYIRQFGDLPFKDLKLSYQVNGGAIFTDMIPGIILNDLTYTFNTPVNISAQGEYLFRVWLINTRDDNLFNDTLVTTRYSKPAPVVDFTYNNQCTGREVQFTGTATILSPYLISSYEWLFGDGLKSTEQNPKHTFSKTGIQKVTFRAYSNAGCFTEIIKSVDLGTVEKLQLKILKKDELCSKSCNGEVDITVIGGESPVQLYFKNALTTQTKISNLCPGTYSIRAVDKKGCEITENVTIGTGSPMDMKIVADPMNGFAPLRVNLKAEGAGAASYEWYYKGKLFSNEPTTSISLIGKGANIIKLIVNSGPPNNCILTVSLSINVEILVEIKIPNAFSPNGDGFNDSIGALTKCVTSLEMNINDRNGRFVHKIDSVNGRWDGNLPSGNLAPQGVYYYSLKAIGYDSLEYSRQGNINLYRDFASLTPNPVQAKAILDLNGNLTGQKSISIFNSSGMLIRKWDTLEDILHLDLSFLIKGVYLIKAKDTDQVVVVKFIKD